MVEQPEAIALEMERILTASPATAFKAFTDPGELARWWGPQGFSIPTLDFQPQAGRSYRIEMEPPDGDSFFLNGEFREVDPPARLSFTFVWEPPDPDDVETLVTLLFRDLGGSTAVDLTQGPFKTEERRDLHRGGWTESFEKLEKLVSPAA